MFVGEKRLVQSRSLKLFDVLVIVKTWNLKTKCEKVVFDDIIRKKRFLNDCHSISMDRYSLDRIRS